MKEIEIPRQTLLHFYHEQHLTAQEVADKLGVSRSTVMKKMKLQNVPMRKNSCYRQTIEMPSDQATLGYIAGLVDGEGTISLYKREDLRGNKVVMIQIGMTHKATIEWLHKIGGTICPRKPRKPNHSTCYVWRLQGILDMLSFLEAIYPFLITKRQAATKAIEFLQWKKVTEVRS